jgi:hypothetical protein
MARLTGERDTGAGGGLCGGLWNTGDRAHGRLCNLEGRNWGSH